MSTIAPDSARPGEPSPYPAVEESLQPIPAPAPRKRRTVLWAAPLAGVLVLGGALGVTMASGSDAQPDTVIPGSAVGYLRVDIDPSVGQKLAAVRLLGKVPTVKQALAGGDARKTLLEALKKDNTELASIDYDQDVAPWLGDRLGIAIMAPKGSEDPEAVMAVQVKDEDKARAGIAKLTAGASAGSDVTFRDGYALVTEKGKGADITKALEKGSLAANQKYSGDMKALGEQGIVSGWLDLPALGSFALKEVSNELSKSGSTQSVPAAFQDSFAELGRTAFAVRFSPDYLELAAVGRGASGIKAATATAAATGTAADLGGLPADTAVAVSGSIRPDDIDQAWKSLGDAGSGASMDGASEDVAGQDVASQVDAMGQIFDLKLPADLKTVLGSRVLLAMPAQDFSGEMPTFGLRTTTDAARAEQIVGKVERVFAGGGEVLPIVHKADGPSFYLASTADYLGQLSRGGKLGEDKAFQLAVPNAGSDASAMYVDLDKLEKAYLPQVPAEQQELVKALRAIGGSFSITGDGTYRYSVRLVGN